MTHDVFISYSSQDKTVADAVCAKLESRKIRCWIAPRDVPAGQPYAAALIKAINTSRIVVLILSADSNKSVHVLREVGEAVDNAIPILPLRIENIEPSEEMRYYIKSLHWLDAMNPPRDRHLEKLAESVQALLAVEGEMPSPETYKEVVAKKSVTFPVWSRIVLIFIAVIIVGGLGAWVFSRMTKNTPTEPTQIAAVEFTEIAIPLPSSSLNESDWRELTFQFADRNFWHPYKNDGVFTAWKQNTETAFAWSNETIEGDFTLNLDLTIQGRQINDGMDDTCIILVYGDGNSWSFGNLSFLIGDKWHIIEKDLPYHEGENFLASIDSNLDIGGQTYQITIEVINDVASLAIDGRKVVIAPIDDEIIRTGKIALEKFQDSRLQCTFSNIKIKTYGSN